MEGIGVTERRACLAEPAVVCQNDERGTAAPVYVSGASRGRAWRQGKTVAFRSMFTGGTAIYHRS